VSVSRRVPRAYDGAAGAVPRGVSGGQYVADPDAEEVVVFLVGMRINRLRKVRSWWPVFWGMQQMLRELEGADKGLLGAHKFAFGRLLVVVQYWRSPQELGAYARESTMLHAPAWGAFNKETAASGDVGIFHETYVVPRGGIETVYGNMTRFGLADATRWVARGNSTVRTSAHERLATTQPEYVEG
jgi:hypothetical protein